MIMKMLKRIVHTPINPRYFFWKRGSDMNADIALTCPRTNVNVVFDVGAHIGEETRKFLKAFRNSKVYSFEPTPITFSLLDANVDSARTQKENLALSSHSGTAQFNVDGNSTSNRIATEEKNAIEVLTTTIDEYCDCNGISGIDILKIDTEGHELNVLMGASKRLSESRIGFLRIECGIDANNTRHVAFNNIISCMQEYGYKMFGIYEQEIEFFEGCAHLRRVDLAFISKTEIEKNRGLVRIRPKSFRDFLPRARAK